MRLQTGIDAVRFAFCTVVQLQISLRSRKRRANIVGKRGKVLTKRRTMSLLNNSRIALRVQFFVYRPRNAGNAPCGEIHRNAFVASAVRFSRKHAMARSSRS